MTPEIRSFEVSATTNIESLLKEVSKTGEYFGLVLKTDKFCKQLANVKNRVTALYFDGSYSTWSWSTSLIKLIESNSEVLEKINLKHIEIQEAFVKSISQCKKLTEFACELCRVDDLRRYREDRPDPEGYVTYDTPTFFQDLAKATDHLTTLSVDGDLTKVRPRPAKYIEPTFVQSKASLLAPVLEKNPNLGALTLDNFVIDQISAAMFSKLKVGTTLYFKTNCTFDDAATLVPHTFSVRAYLKALTGIKTNL